MHRLSPRRTAVVAGAAALACVAAGAGIASAATAKSSSAATTSVIVILGDQSGKPASVEAPVIARAKQAGATAITSYSAVASFAATVTPAEETALRNDPAVSSVVPNSKIKVAPVSAGDLTATKAAVKKSTAKLPAGVCGTAQHPQVPEYLASTGAGAVQREGINGAGVTVGFIADGVDPNNADFQRNGKSIFSSYVDFSGSGTDSQTGGEEAFGDASSIAAQGNETYDVSNFVNSTDALPNGCDLKIIGMAPGANLVGLKALGFAYSTSSILQSIQYAMDHGVNVLNESFGGNGYPDVPSLQAIDLFNDKAVADGVTVVASTGDAGVSGTQGSPSTDPKVISAGASTDFQNYEQTDYAGARTFSNGRWVSDNISSLSSGGFNQLGGTPDLVAPGESDWTLCSTDTSIYTECVGYNGKPTPIFPFGGTSQSSPLTAGAAALVIEAYRSTHDGALPAPALVKQFLTSTADDLGLPAGEQGAGLLNAKAAVAAAENYRAPARANDEVLSSTSQVTLSGAPGRHVSTTVGLTNSGSRAEQVRLGTRSYATTSNQTQNVAVNAATDPTFPYSTNGLPWAYKKATFTIRPGQARLAVSIDWKGEAEGYPASLATPGAVVRLTLIGPDGAFVTNSRPQGGTVSANYGLVDVAHPQGGTWTAVLYTPTKAAAVAGQPTPFTGNVILNAVTQRDVSEGTVSPSSVTLRPGETRDVTLNTAIAADTGDSAESLTLATSDGQRSSVPVVLRPIIPITRNTGTFSGTITGGNGRAGSPTQSNTYAFNVPAGERDLEVGIHLDQDKNVAIEGVLVDPDGQAIDVGTNVTSVNPNTYVTTSGANTQLVQNAPEAGAWRFILVVVDPVSGAEVSQGFTGKITLNQVTAASTLPKSAGTKLTAGKANTFSISYRNPGLAAEEVQADPRLDGTATVTLPSLSGTNTVPLPVTADNEGDIPLYEVPPGTTSLSLTSTATTPANIELEAAYGVPDIVGNLTQSGTSSISVATAATSGGRSQLARGLWETWPQQIGPFTTNTAPSGSITMTATAVTQPLDTTVTSKAGDPFATGFTDADPTGTPVVVQPGKSGSLAVTITPKGAAGTVVRGVIYLVTSPFTGYDNLSLAQEAGLGAVLPSGDVLAAIPYTYTIK